MKIQKTTFAFMNARFHDKIRQLRAMTFGKLMNGFLLWFSFHWSAMLKKPILLGKPYSISVEPTTACNLRCPECPSGLRQFSRNTGNLQLGLFKKIIDDMSSHLSWLTFYFQGEPFIHPDIFQLINMASKKRIYTSTSSNAHFFDDNNAKKVVESGLDRLIISIDGTSQDTYEQYRKEGSLEKVIEGTKNVIKWKRQLNSRTPFVVFQFLVVGPNEHQIGEIEKLSQQLGVDELKLKSAQVYDYKNGNELIPNNEEYSRYKKNKDGTFSIKANLSNKCWRMWQSSVITWDGLVVPCCFDKDAKHQMGDLKEESFQNVWANEKYQSFRKTLLRSRQEIDICKNCCEGSKVWV